MVDSVASRAGTETAERVADVLLALTGPTGSMGVSAIARELSLSKAVVHRILQSLASRGLVSLDPASREYRLGPMAASLGARALRDLDLRALARGELIDLRNRTKETTTLSLLTVEGRSYIEQFESPQEIKMTVELGRVYPLYAGSSSRAILAHLSDVEMERVLGHVRPLTPATITVPDQLRRSLEEVRELGYASSRGERQAGAASVAAPIFRGDGSVVGAISICGPVDRFTLNQIPALGALVAESAHKISVAMGSTARELSR